MKSIALVIAVTFLAATAASAQDAPPAATAAPTAQRPGEWAVPIALEGAPNLHRISPLLYRSEQPTAVGMKNLEKLGIRTVINLRYFNHDDDEVEGTTLRTERTKILTWRVDDRHVIEVMRLLKNPANGPFLIHCQHGADRTGLMSAMYRRLYDGWSADDALRELTDGGYGYHSIWRNIQKYVRNADLERLRAAIDAPAAEASRETEPAR